VAIPDADEDHAGRDDQKRALSGLSSRSGSFFSMLGIRPFAL
jgi:hypothetical protein